MFRVLLLTCLLSALLLTSGMSADSPPARNPAEKKPPAKKPGPKAPEKKAATSPEALATLPGFQVELLHTADPATEGSWIAMTTDGKGRLILAGQRGQPILRVTLQSSKVHQIEKLDLGISEAMGLLYAYDSLYVNGAGPGGGYGLYRCRDTKGTDQYDEVKLLKNFGSGGEHGAHGLAVGPDKKLYVINGNHTNVPEGLSPQSPHRNYREDHLLPRQWDGNGHAAGRLAPGGYVLRTDPEGKSWEIVLGGFRNAYDIAFNGDGELFTFDSDMEWDWGMPWYRPIRVNHCTSASEFGWRSGTGKWPEYYPDSLPATLNVGIGSPTGVVAGSGAKFPARYQKAVYVLDWTYGRILAVHLTPKGSSYSATSENFVVPLSVLGKGPPHPLNVTDAVVGPDGAFYFSTGGRNTQAGLYRVTYTGKESTAPAPLVNEEGSKERQLRHELEAFHGKQDPTAVEKAWPHLGSPDRFLRYAARLAIESQPVAEWQARALAEKDPEAALTALLALARVGDAKAQADLLTSLARFPLDKLSDDQKLEKLRLLQLTCVRQGRPAVPAAKKLLAELEPAFPGENELINREVVQLLIYLNSTQVVPRALKHMAAAKTQEDQMHYLFHLRTMPIGFWTLDQRREYFSYYQKDRKRLPYSASLVKYFADVARKPDNGASFPNFLRNFFREAVTHLSAGERKELAGLLDAIDKSAVPTYDIKPRPLVKVWKAADLESQLSKIDRGRNYAKGKEAFLVGQCVKCHRFDNEGGAVGPDLTAVSRRFSRRDILESILEPSKVISDQYQSEILTTGTGKVVTGRVVDETTDQLFVQPDPLTPERVGVKKADLETREPSKVSPMPEHLVDGLTNEEILDLVAYLESGGDKNYWAFQR